MIDRKKNTNLGKFFEDEAELGSDDENKDEKRAKRFEQEQGHARIAPLAARFGLCGRQCRGAKQGHQPLDAGPMDRLARLGQ